jgi:hypothetical protein
MSPDTPAMQKQLALQKRHEEHLRRMRKLREAKTNTQHVADERDASDEGTK